MIKFDCPHCGKCFNVPDLIAGKSSTCPKCGQPQRVPQQGNVTPMPQGNTPNQSPSQPIASIPQAEPAFGEFPSPQDDQALKAKREEHMRILAQMDSQERARRKRYLLVGGGAILAISLVVLVILFLNHYTEERRKKEAEAETARIAEERRRFEETYKSYMDKTQPLYDSLLRTSSDLQVGINYASFQERVRDMNFQKNKWMETLTQDEAKWPSVRLLQAVLDCYVDSSSHWQAKIEDPKSSLVSYHESEMQSEWSTATTVLKYVKECFKQRDVLRSERCTVCIGTGQERGSKCIVCDGTGMFPPAEKKVPEPLPPAAKKVPEPVPPEAKKVPESVPPEAKDGIPHSGTDNGNPVEINGMTYVGKNAQGFEEFKHEKTGMVFVKIPGGTFKMGSEHGGDEKPIHEVRLDGFLISKFEVTQAVWRKEMWNNPAEFGGDDNPVEGVSWNDCQGFCKATGLSLPTEAEWEYACRAGTNTSYYWGDEPNGDYVWYDKNSDKETHPVGRKKPNGFGLYDMAGNVWEWCADWYGKYVADPQDNPKGPASGEQRVIRGGGWNFAVGNCRSAFRFAVEPTGLSNRYGFRCVRDLTK